MIKNIVLILLTGLFISCCIKSKHEQQSNSILFTNDSILDKEFYLSGELKSITYIKDSMILNYNEKCTKLYIEYYKNGIIKEKGCQGVFDAKGTPVGTRYEYDSINNLIRTTYFHPDEFGKDYKIVKDYDESGLLISNKIFRNDELYEFDMIELKEIPK